jgi:hypothetical protein
VSVIFQRTINGTRHTLEAQGSGIISYGADSTLGESSILSSVTLTDLTTNVVLETGLTLRISASDGKKGVGSVGFTLWSGDTLRFSSNWDGLQTLRDELGGGSIQVH